MGQSLYYMARSKSQFSPDRSFPKFTFMHDIAPIRGYTFGYKLYIKVYKLCIGFKNNSMTLGVLVLCSSRWEHQIIPQEILKQNSS